MEQPALGQKITALRYAKGITQKELADLCKVDVRTIQRIEAGEVTPRMYTLNLLSLTLGDDLKDKQKQVVLETISHEKDLRAAYIAGIVCSLNSILIVIQLTDKPFNGFFQTATFAIQSISSIAVYYGFYVLAKSSKNWLLTISLLLLMVILPINNVVYVIAPFAVSLLFIALCINLILVGAGIFLQASRNKGILKTLYSVTGIIGIAQSCMLMSFNFTVQCIGLITSLGCNVLVVVILFLEYQNAKQTTPPANKTIFA